MVKKNWKVELDNLDELISKVPKARPKRNLLFQLQKCRESDRPISEIHFTLHALEDSMNQWQKKSQEAYLALIKEQERWMKKLIELNLDNMNFQKVRAFGMFISFLYDHTRTLSK